MSERGAVADVETIRALLNELCLDSLENPLDVMRGDTEGHIAVTFTKLDDAIAALVSERERLQREADHWKAIAEAPSEARTAAAEAALKRLGSESEVVAQLVEARAEVERLTAQLAHSVEDVASISAHSSKLAAQLAEAQQALREIRRRAVCEKDHVYTAEEALSDIVALAVSPGEPERAEGLGGTAGGRSALVVEIELKETSQTLVYGDAVNTYTKGALYCVYRANGTVVKFPLANIWRITEEYRPERTQE